MITESGLVFDLQSGTFLNDNISILQDKNILNIGVYLNSLIIVLDDYKVYKLEAPDGQLIFLEELKNKKIISSEIMDEYAVFITEDGKAYDIFSGEVTCINDAFEELSDKKIIKYDVMSNGFILDDGEALVEDNGTWISLNNEIEILKEKKIMTVDFYTGLIWLIDGESFYNMDSTEDAITYLGFEEFLIGENIVQMSVGAYHSVILDNEGKIWTWGENFDGILGDGTEEDRDIPICISDIQENPLEEIEIIQISAGYQSSVALDKNGKVWTWGRSPLGDGTENNSDIPICISDIIDNPLNGVDIIEVGCGLRYAIALDTNGKVWTWGSNYYGQLGNETTNDSSIPICISDMIGNPLHGVHISKIYAGDWHAIVVDNNGKVWSWGENNKGSLGNETTNNSSIPICISDIIGNPLNEIKIVDIAAGGSHSIVLDNNGRVWTWGGNYSGQLGDGTKNDSNIPICISDINSSLKGKKIIKIAESQAGTVLLDDKDGYYVYGGLYSGDQ